jgi:putative exosortase-associated protein (TIGR04073 family)
MFRKLTRGLSNMVYGSSEIPVQWVRSSRTEGTTGAGSYGILLGGHRTLMRFGYGLWEVVTFFEPAYKRSYKPPYQDVDFIPNKGYHEFAPQIGFVSEATYVRTQAY